MRIKYLNSLLIVGLMIVAQNSFGQQLVPSESWTGTGGQNAVFNHVATETDALRNVYVAGSTLDNNNKLDIILQKFDSKGVLLWEVTYNGDADSNDVATDIFVDANYNVYLTGSSVEVSGNGYDLVVLKYNSDGVFQWDYFKDNGASPDPRDGGAAITGDNNGFVYATGSSMTNGKEENFITVRLDETNGVENWVADYDQLSFTDAASFISYRNGEVKVSGGSKVEENPEKWDITTIYYDTADGSQNSISHSGASTTDGIIEVFDATKDDNGNLYITGKSDTGSTGYDICIYKLNDNLSLEWEKHIDGHGLDDQGNGIKVDDSGNVYVSGYVTDTTEGKNYKVLKYNSSGSFLWQREFNGKSNLDDESTQLIVSDTLLFVTGYMNNSGNEDYSTVILNNSSGRILTQIDYEGEFGLNDRPISIAKDTDGSVIVAGQIGKPIGFETKTVKYDLYSRSFTPEAQNDSMKFVESEILIRFDRSAIKYEAINNKRKNAGPLSDFITSDAIDSLEAKTGVSCEDLETYKIFRGMIVADTLSITRLGDTIKIPDHWASLAVYFPKNLNELKLVDSINTIKDIVLFSGCDYFPQGFGVPDDDLYLTEQTGLYDPLYGIDVEDAWDIQEGNDETKVGVFDSGINHHHDEYYVVTVPGSVNTWIKGGKDYYNGGTQNVLNQSNPDIDGHGTAIAGIIGGKRDNDMGVAGIAGGDQSDANFGVSMYNMRISLDGETFAPLSVIASAITEGAVNTLNAFGDKLHFQNHSWGLVGFPDSYIPVPYPHSFPFLRSAVKTCFKNNCSFIASSGNISETPNGNSNQAYILPAIYHDTWVSKVGGSDDGGARWDNSVYGNNLDFIAPATSNIYATLDHDDNSGYSYDGSGTSFSAPHVLGGMALMHGEHTVDNGYPNGLAPEDMEYLLEKYATDVESSGYDDETGHGRISVYNSLVKITMPEYFIKHFTVNQYSSLSQIGSSDQVVTIKEVSNGIPKGVYYADKYLVQFSYSSIFPSNQHILDYWVRYASSGGVYPDNNELNDFGYIDLNESVTQSTLIGTAGTYCYYISEEFNSNNPVGKWYPEPPEDIKLAYSVQVQDVNYTSIEEDKSDFKINVYPNPNNGILNVNINNDKNTNVTLSIVDITGKKIHEKDFGETKIGENNYSINVDNLSSGVYFCIFNLNEEVVTKKVVKQ